MSENPLPSAEKDAGLRLAIIEHRYSPGIESPTHGRTPYNAGCYCGETFSSWDDDVAWPEYAEHISRVTSPGGPDA